MPSVTSAPGRPINLTILGQGPNVLSVDLWFGIVWIFFLVYHFFLNFFLPFRSDCLI